MKPAYTALGKEVLHNGAHHADAVSHVAAFEIAVALNLFNRRCELREARRATPTDTARAGA